MGAKDIRVAPIKAQDANAFVDRWHYSHGHTRNSQLHLGVFLDGRVHGVMQFGPSMDKGKLIGLVSGTAWGGFLELNRLAFDPALPRNSESRAISVALRMIRAAAPYVEWVVSFADATQCGDGAIYRAAGFVLTGIAKNKTLIRAPNGEAIADLALLTMSRERFLELAAGRTGGRGLQEICAGKWSTAALKPYGFTTMAGFQLRYLYFLNRAARGRLTVPVIPFSEIERRGAGMYLGQRRQTKATATDQVAQRRCDSDPGAPSEDEQQRATA